MFPSAQQVAHALVRDRVVDLPSIIIEYVYNTQVHNQLFHYVEKIAEADDGRPVGEPVAAIVDSFAQGPPFFPHVLVGLFTWKSRKIVKKKNTGRKEQIIIPLNSVMEPATGLRRAGNGRRCEIPKKKVIIETG